MFYLEELWDLFSRCGFDPVENGYIQRETVNHKEGKSATRVFVQGKYLKRGGNPTIPVGCSSVEGQSQGHASGKGESQVCDIVEGELPGCGSVEGVSDGNS